jgi:hypothetical protein
VKVLIATFFACMLFSQSMVVSANTTQSYVSLDQLDTSPAYLQQIRSKFLDKMSGKCPATFTEQHCGCVSGLMFDELTPVQQSLIGEGFVLEQKYPGKTELEIGNLIAEKFGPDNIQKKDIRERWQKAQMQAFNTCKLPL